MRRSALLTDLQCSLSRCRLYSVPSRPALKDLAAKEQLITDSQTARPLPCDDMTELSLRLLYALSVLDQEQSGLSNDSGRRSQSSKLQTVLRFLLLIMSRGLNECIYVRLLCAGYQVLLDKRVLKTPSTSTVLSIPLQRSTLAGLIAHEWDNQDQTLKPHALPLVRYPHARPRTHFDDVRRLR